MCPNDTDVYREDMDFPVDLVLCFPCRCRLESFRLALPNDGYVQQSASGDGRSTGSFIMRQLIYSFRHDGCCRLRNGIIRDLRFPFKLQNVRPSRADIENFVDQFLKKDGVVVLRLIDSNVGYVNMSDILYQLWNNFYSIDGKKLALPTAPPVTNS